jgi:hypothetical protein
MDALYETRDGAVFATEYTRGPWDPNHQHGGAPAALLMREFERCEPDPTLGITRVTYELLRPVPLGELSVSASVIRPGRRVQLLEGSIFAGDTEVVRARALRVLQAPVAAGGSMYGTFFHGMAPTDFSRFSARRTMFPGDGVEVSFQVGEFGTPGPAAAWFRLKVPVVAGEEPSALQRMAAAADFPNGIASELPWDRYVFINPDLTLYIEREPVGDWILLDARMSVHEDGNAITHGTLSDTGGRVGRSLQSLYVARR